MRKDFRRLLATIIVFSIVLGISMPKVSNKEVMADAGKTYVLDGYSASDLLSTYGVIAISELDIQAHTHSNFLTSHLTTDKDCGIRSTYGVDQDSYFGSFSGSLNETLLTRANARLFIGDSRAQRVTLLL